MLKVLVVCEHNAGRSQIAYTYLNEYGGEQFSVECGGLDPLPLNPLVVEVMKEEGFDINNIDNSYSVVDLIKLKRQYHVVITVCSRETDALCPVFPGKAMRLNWPYPDPETFDFDEEEMFTRIRLIRDGIKSDVRNFVRDYKRMGMSMIARLSYPI